MATSLEKLENEVQVHHLHVERFHMVKRLRKSVQYRIVKGQGFISPVGTGRQRAHTPSPSDSQL